MSAHIELGRIGVGCVWITDRPHALKARGVSHAPSFPVGLNLEMRPSSVTQWTSLSAPKYLARAENGGR